MNRLIHACLARPVIVCAVAVLLSLLCGLGVFRIGITADYRVFFSDDNPQLQRFAEQEALFLRSDTLVYGIDAPVFDARTLEAIDWLTRRAAALPHISRVGSLTNTPHLAGDDDRLRVGTLLDMHRVDGEVDLAGLRAATLTNPELMGRLVDWGGRTALIVATVQLPGIDIQAETPAVILPARELLAEFQARFPGIGAQLFGVVPFNQSLTETTLRDLWLLFPFSLALMAATLFWLLGGAIPLLLTGVVVGVAVAIAMGLAGWYGVVLTTATAVAPVIILTLGVAHSVHLITNVQHALAGGADRAAALRHSLALNLRPITLTSLTTMAGFLSLNFSDAPPFRELGNIVALGVVVTWAAALLLLPPLALRLGAGRASQRSSGFWAAFGRQVSRARVVILLLMAAVLAPVLAQVPGNAINDVFREWFALSDPGRAGIEFGIERLGGVEELHYTLDSGTSAGVAEPAFATQVQAFSDWLRGQPEVAHVSSYLHTLKFMHRVLRDDRVDQYELPPDAALGSGFLSTFEMTQPPGRGLNAQLDLDKRRARLSLTMRPTTSSELRAFDRRARDWAAANTPRLAMEQASGALMMFAELGQRNARSLLAGAVLVLVLISAVLVLALGSLRVGLMSLVPNLLPAAVGFGIWALISGEINIAISVVMGMTLGIVVDDTIHFVSKYQAARRAATGDAAVAIEQTFVHVGRALTVTTAVLVAGFLVLALSDFRPTADMGLLTAIIIAVALVLDLLLLPALLLITDRSTPSR